MLENREVSPERVDVSGQSRPVEPEIVAPEEVVAPVRRRASPVGWQDIRRPRRADSESTEEPFWDDEDREEHERRAREQPPAMPMTRGESIESMLSLDENGEFRQRVKRDIDPYSYVRDPVLRRRVATVACQVAVNNMYEEKESESKKEHRRKWRQTVTDGWKKSFLVGSFANPLPPMLNTVGITKDQEIRLSYIVSEAIKPSVDIKIYYHQPRSDKWDPFIMIHQTNEHEIMNTLGSFRMNPWSDNKKDIESLAYLEADAIVSSIIRELSFEEGNRRYAPQPVYDELTLEEAYHVGQGIPIREEKARFGIAEYMRHMDHAMKHTKHFPVIHCKKPVVGMPFKAYLKNAMDLETCKIDLLRAINTVIKHTAIQIIDLRVRYEDTISLMPWYLDDKTVAEDVIEVINRSVDTLDELRTTAKYFVVYGFHNFRVPMRFYQAVVRFKPGLPIVQQDWEEITTPRQVITDEPEPDPIDFETLFEPPYPEPMPRVVPDVPAPAPEL